MFSVNGMPSFKGILTNKDVKAIHAYIIGESKKAFAAQERKPQGKKASLLKDVR
jgi:mono/diheme cytochrome c family protein